MKIICIGRNYEEHANEMKAEVPTEPVFFIKPDTALLTEGKDFYYPLFTNDLHYEVEIVLKISKPGKAIEKMFASNYYNEVGIGIDFTARDIQSFCKQKGLPWEKAKAFDFSAPVGLFIKKESITDLKKLSFSLYKNGSLVQQGNTANMIFDFDEIIHYVSQYVTLKTGDLIFTGTPAGVGPVKIGDVLEGYLENQKMLTVNIR
jgi:2-keto-4-pentenoate hydratase/2-oxohepta-3-ene-1,7-dioic acid hydratase in catechol pathway